MTTVLCVGLAAMDFVLTVPELSDKPLKYRAQEAAVVGGGGAANAAVAVSRLGGRALLATRLGDDSVGQMIASDLAGDRVALVSPQDAGARSSFSAILVDQQGERQITNFRGDGFREDLSWAKDLPKLGAVLADTRWTACAAAMLDLARGQGIPGVVDCEAPMDDDLLHRASHLAFSAQGMHSVTGTFDPKVGLPMLAARFAGWICVTCGENGVWFLRDGVLCHEAAFQVTAKDTTGAGDAWHGAFALALAEGQAEPAAIRFANATAALKCAQFGGRSGNPDRAAVAELLASGMQYA